MGKKCRKISSDQQADHLPKKCKKKKNGVPQGN